MRDLLKPEEPEAPETPSVPTEPEVPKPSEAPPTYPQGPIVPQEPTEIPQIPKKGGFFKKIVLPILIFFLLVAGLINLNERNVLQIGLEKYYNKIFLEKLWFGFPKDPLMAMASLASNMKENENYHFKMIATVEIKEGKALQKTESQGGKVLGEEVGPATESQTIPLNLEGDVDKEDISLSLDADLGSLGETFGLPISTAVVQAKKVGDKVYLKLPSLDILIGEKNKWLLFSASDLKIDPKQLNLEQILPSTSLEKCLKSGKREDSVTVEGTPSYHFQIELEKSCLLGQQKNIDLKDVFDIYVGKKDHLLKKVKLELNYQKEILVTAQIETTFSGYGKVAAIIPPSETEVEKEGLLGLLGSLSPELEKSLGQSEVKVKDAKRKSDLASIQAALEMYYSENSEYPISKEIDRTNNKEGVLNKALVPKYIKELPKDPKDPEMWYGYKGDGKTYELWSLLEDKTDPKGKQEGDWFIYKIKGEAK